MHSRAKICKKRMLILIGGPCSGKTTLAKLVVSSARSLGVSVRHYDDKSELVRICRKSGMQKVDYGVNKHGVITWVSEDLLTQRVPAMTERITRRLARLDAVVVEFCGLSYKKELSLIMRLVPKNCRRIVILRDTLPELLERNRQRTGKRGHNRSIPTDFILAYSKKRRDNEEAISAGATIVEGKLESDTLAEELALWLSRGTKQLETAKGKS